MKESNEMTNYGVVKDSSEKNRRKGMSQAKRLGKNFERRENSSSKNAEVGRDQPFPILDRSCVTAGQLR